MQLFFKLTYFKKYKFSYCIIFTSYSYVTSKLILSHTLSLMVTPQVQVLMEWRGNGQCSSFQEEVSHSYTQISLEYDFYLR